MQPERSNERGPRDEVTPRRPAASRNYLSYLCGLRQAEKSGLLTITNGSTTRSFLIDRGILRAVGSAEPVTYYRGLVLGLEKIKERKLDKLLRSNAGQGVFLPELVAREGLASREVVAQLLEVTAARELIARGQKRGATIQFSTEARELPVALGAGSREWTLTIDLAELVLETCRDRGQGEDLIADRLPGEDTVFLTVPGADGELADTTLEVLKSVDGRSPVAEIVGRAGRSRFEVLSALLLLECYGSIRRANPEELALLADRFRSEGRADKALELYLAAEKAGVEREDLSLTVGRSYELMGDQPRAVLRYLEHATIERGTKDPEGTLEVLRRVLDLDKENLEARNRVLVLLKRMGSVDDLVVEYRAYAQIARSRGDEAGAADALEQVIALGRGDEALFTELTSLLSKSGNPTEAVNRFRRLASEHASRWSASAARQLHEHLGRLEPESLDIKVELARALEEEGRKDAALVVYEEILGRRADEDLTNTGKRGRIEFAASRLLERNSTHLPALETLADLALARQDGESGRDHLRTLARLYGEAGALGEQRRTLERLWELGEGDFETILQLARSQAEGGAPGLAVETLLTLARRAEKAQNDEDLLRAAGEALVWNPLSIEARELRAGAWRRAKDGARLLEELESLSRLTEISGDREIQERTLVQMIDLNPRLADPRWRLAGLLQETNREAEAVEQWSELAKVEDRAGNQGRAEEACDRILRLVPGHPQAARMRESLRGQNPLLLPDTSREEALQARIRDLENSLKDRIEALADRLVEPATERTLSVPSVELEVIEPIREPIRESSCEPTFEPVRESTRELDGPDLAALASAARQLKAANSGGPAPELSEPQKPEVASPGPESSSNPSRPDQEVGEGFEEPSERPGEGIGSIVERLKNLRG